jgi:hypothetical protein
MTKHTLQLSNLIVPLKGNKYLVCVSGRNFLQIYFFYLYQTWTTKRHNTYVHMYIRY